MLTRLENTLEKSSLLFSAQSPIGGLLEVLGLILFIGILCSVLYATKGKSPNGQRKDMDGWAEAQRDEWG